MSNRKFLYGFGIGILVTKLYKFNREKIKIVLIKTIQGALAFTDDTKDMLREVENSNDNKNAKVTNKNSMENSIHYNKPNINIMDDSLPGEIQILNDRLLKLKNQINDLEKLS